MKLEDAIEKLHPIVPISPFIFDILKEYTLSDTTKVRIKNLNEAVEKATQEYRNAHVRTSNTKSDYAYWSALGTETVWETVVNLLRTAQKVGADNLPDIAFPDLSDKVVMDAQYYMVEWGRKMAREAGVTPLKVDEIDTKR